MSIDKKPFALGRFNKYGVSSKTDRTYEGIVFDSKWELKAYKWLLANLDAPMELQPKFVLLEKFKDFTGASQREIAYFADFLIHSQNPDQFIIVDAKGMLTADFKLKRKLFLAKYSIPLYLPKNEKQLKEIPWEKHGIKLKKT